MAGLTFYFTKIGFDRFPNFFDAEFVLVKDIMGLLRCFHFLLVMSKRRKIENYVF